MKKRAVVVLSGVLLLLSCRKQEERLYTLGIFQVNDAPTLTEVRKGFIQALTDSGLRNGVNISLKIRNAMGDITEAQRIAEEFVRQRTDVIVALSTPCLQAAMMATQRVPILFASVANPNLVGVGKTAENHLRNITGVASNGPVKQTLAFIKEVLPGIRRIGTLWTPSELNSDYYLQVAREGATELGLEIIAVPVASESEVLLSAQMLLNKKVDVLFPISDNTINAAFDSLGRLAEDNATPLFGGNLVATRLGACAAMGWDFFEMGYKAGEIAVRIRNGEDPGRIPLQSMSKIKLYLNLLAAKKQGIVFSPEVIQRADEVIGAQPPSELGLSSR